MFLSNFRKKYLENLSKQEEYLDKINLSSYIDKYQDLYDLYCAIQNDYDNTEITNNKFLNGRIFRYIDPVELSTYIEKKYNINYEVWTAFGEYF